MRTIRSLLCSWIIRRILKGIEEPGREVKADTKGSECSRYLLMFNRYPALHLAEKLVAEAQL